MSVIKAGIATILYVLFFELVSTWAIIPELLGHTGHFEYYMLIQSSIQAILLALIVYVFLKTPIPTFLEKGIMKWYLIAVISGIAFVFLQTPLNWIYFGLFNEEHTLVYDFDGFRTLTNVDILAYVVLIPLSEEIFFREIIQKRILKNGSVFVAILLSALLFASIHAPYEYLFFHNFAPSLHNSFIAFFGGLMSAYLYQRSGSLGPALVSHCTWNLVVFII